MEDRNEDSNQKGMDDQPCDIRKDNDTKSTETHLSENPTETAKEVNRLAPTTMAVSPKEIISRTFGNSEWAFEQKNKESFLTHQVNTKNVLVISREIITEKKNKQKNGLRIEFEANLGAKRQSTFESTSNKAINNNPERIPVVDCSDTTMPELISAIPSTSAAQYLSSSGPAIEKFPTNNKPEACYVCEQCGKAFIDSYILKKHYITHSTERPFSCKDCKKNFKRKADFNKHNRLHTGKRLLTCNECRKKFTTASSLSVHEKIHTGDKPYVCRTCGKAFNHSSNKKRHEKICKGLLKSHERN